MNESPKEVKKKPYMQARYMHTTYIIFTAGNGQSKFGVIPK